MEAVHAFEFVRDDSGPPQFATIGDVDMSVAEKLIDLDAENNAGLQAVKTARPGQPFHSSSFMNLNRMCPDGTIRKFFDPHGFDKALMIRLPDTEGASSHATFFRRRDEKDFDARDGDVLTRHANHLFSAFRMRTLWRQRRLREQVAQQMQAIGRKAEALMIVTRDLRVIDADALAQSLLEQGDPLRLRHGRLTATSAGRGEAGSDLGAYVARPDAASPPLKLLAKDGRLHKVTALPVGPDTINAGIVTPSVTALVIELRLRRRRPDLESFVLAFNLTKAEARLLRALTEADSAADAARRLGLSPNTAKTHLSNIFSKTETTSQSQLMLLLGGYT